MFAASKTDSVSTGDYQISRSLRFNSDNTTYLDRTPASASNQKTWTWSGWVKRSTLGAATFFNAGNNGFVARFNSSTNYLEVYNYTSAYQLQVITAQVFRDFSAWYHIVIAIDTTQATDTNRFKLYVNGSQVTSFYGAPTYPSQNADLLVNGTGVHAIGVLYTVGALFNGYMTEVNFIDGQALTPSSFGETNAQTGVWQPKAYSGSYGTNGFYLNFSDNSNTTAATLGKDYSGNGNNWTPNGFSVSAGAGNDSMVDVPTPYGVDTGAGGTVRGNYCTWNPISNSAGSLVNGNLQLNGTNSAITRCNSTMAVSSGKWYFETTLTTANSYTSVGIGQGFITDGYPGADALSYAQTLEGPNKINNNVQPTYGVALTSGDIFICAFDLDNNKIFFGKNGTWFDSSNPATGTNPAFTLTAGTYCPIARPYDASSVINSNFGQRPFAYSAPSGFKALCTQNLPTPTIGATSTTLANSFFTTNLWAGNNGVQTVTNNINTTNGGGLIWFKARNLTVNQFVVNSGSGYTKFLAANTTAAEDTFDFGFTPSTGGFSFNSGSGSVNQSGYNYVAWQWKAGGAGVTNNAGSITSTVSANTTSGFSIITWTGNATQNATIGHGLGAKPALIIVKNRSSGPKDWPVKFKTFSTSQYIYLNGTGAVASYGFYFPTEATSSVIYLGSDADVNGNGNLMVCYAFAEIAGYSAFGSYVGNGSASGPFVYTGFRPAFLLIRSTGVESWFLFDVARGTYNDNMPFIQANTNGPEYAFDTPEIMSNGFKLSTNNASVNGNGNTMIYAAFAETPFKYSLAR